MIIGLHLLFSQLDGNRCKLNVLFKKKIVPITAFLSLFTTDPNKDERSKSKWIWGQG